MKFIEACYWLLVIAPDEQVDKIGRIAHYIQS